MFLPVLPEMPICLKRKKDTDAQSRKEQLNSSHFSDSVEFWIKDKKGQIQIQNQLSERPQSANQASTSEDMLSLTKHKIFRGILNILGSKF